MEIDRFRVYLLLCEGLCGFGALLVSVAGRWDIAACAWALACYCAINRVTRKPQDSIKIGQWGAE